MANDLIAAEVFELSGEGASITYDRRARELSYEGPSQPPLEDFLQVTQTVEPLETPLGSLLTATLDAVEDGDAKIVSVLLPDVRLPAEGSGSATVETVAIYATIRSSFGGPSRVEGSGQLYVAAALRGTARLGDANPSY